MINKTKIKRGIVLALSFSLLLSMSACSNVDTEKKDEMVHLTIKEIQDKEKEGFFVLNKDNTFTPVLASVSGYRGAAAASLPSRILWFTDNRQNTSSLIPVVNKSSRLVMVFNSNNNMPSKYMLEKYDFKGYTLGAHFMLGEDRSSIYMSTQDMLEDSQMKQKLSAADLDERVEISLINGSDKLPLQNVDVNMNVLLGLEKNKYYSISFYNGTTHNQLDAKADTYVFQSSEMITLNKAYKKINKGYFEIILPENLESGYYYICDAGLFRYEKPK